ILFTPIVLFYHYKIAGKMQEAGRVDNCAKRDMWRITSETFRGFADVMVNCFLPYLRKSFDKGVHDVSRSKIRVERLRSLSSKSIEVAIMLMIVGFVAGFYFIGGGDRQFLPLIGIFAAASLKLLPSVRSILSLVGTMRNTAYSLEVLFNAPLEPAGIAKEARNSQRAAIADEARNSQPTDNVKAARNSQPADNVNEARNSQPAANVNEARNSQPAAIGGENSSGTATLTFHKFIEFRNVTFGFEPGEPVLQDVSFRILKGERVGISGPTGKGKSTLMYLMMGLYRPQAGTILIDGVPLGPENTEAWHRKIGYVSQDVFITEGTLAQNVTPSWDDASQQMKDAPRQRKDAPQQMKDAPRQRNDASQQMKDAPRQMKDASWQMKDASRQMKDAPWQRNDASQQRVDEMERLENNRGRLTESLKTAALNDWLATLPQGVDTPIGESGARLSGGERQRVGIARAHFKKAEILFMDEPTSALDPATEAEITETLLQDFMNRDITMVIISHRDSLLAHCERIINISEWTKGVMI
ncbi:MAG: ABC transporter ATP-binding protein, partial [Candidatus Absconditabacterales bacterium]